MSIPYISAFWDLLFPRVCHACSQILHPSRQSRFDDNLCVCCAAAMKRLPLVTEFAKDKKNSWDRLISCFVFESRSRALIHEFKYHNRPYLSKTLTRLMLSSLGRYATAIFEQIDIIVPIPLFPARFREREYNQAELLGQEWGRLFNKPVQTLLRRIRDTRSQATLPSERRQDNIRGAFAPLSQNFSNHHILLIDDVVTTGATVAEAARTLRSTGTRQIDVLTFARG